MKFYKESGLEPVAKEVRTVYRPYINVVECISQAADVCSAIKGFGGAER